MIKILTAVLALSLLVAGAAWAATNTNTLTINATVANQATLTIGGGKTASISFPDSDPDTMPSIAVNPCVSGRGGHGQDRQRQCRHLKGVGQWGSDLDRSYRRNHSHQQRHLDRHRRCGVCSRHHE